MEEEIICNECGWTGDATMLVSETEAMNDLIVEVMTLKTLNKK